MSITASDILDSLNTNYPHESKQVPDSLAKICSVAMAAECNGKSLDLSKLISESKGSLSLFSVAQAPQNKGRNI